MNLRTKFTLYISLLIIFVICGISISIFFTQKSLLSSQLEKNRKKSFEDFLYTCKESLVVNDEIQVLNTIRSIIKIHYPTIVYAGYISPSQIVLFNSRDAERQEDFKSRITRVSEFTTVDFVSHINEKIKEFSMPIYLDNEYRGTIKAGYSQTYLENEIKQAVIALGKKIMQVSVLALFCGLLLSSIIAFFFNKPIKALAKAANEIGAGNLDSKVEIHSKDELGSLGHTFNDMARKLKELDELKDSFVSSVSHELRSPLAAIDGYCDFLIEGFNRNMPREKQEKSLKIIKDATIRLTNFINNVLDIAKIKAGRFELRKTPVSFNDLAEEIVSLFVSLGEQQQKKIFNAVAKDLPNIFADPERIKQVITNLVGNALKFTKAGSEISIGARLNEDGQSITGWVKDTGIGIPPDDLTRVFERFFQVKESGMKKPKGTGLGLAIVAEIIKLHNGRIWVESTLGQGSTFKFTIPVYKRIET
ncbi:MAG: HAMP domain-containing histidine kinase [Elusimicrobia bacterium]|nr:HAMP domain-containing histidine kinase [Candidatus Liberimonas magnetica]